MLLDPAKLAHLYGAASHSSPPHHFGTRYDAHGQFLPEAGNTVVCHLVTGSETELALIAAQKRLRAMPEAHKLAFTPVESYHMTLFQGVLEGRRKTQYWPDDVAEDAPISDMTALFLQRLATFSRGPSYQVEVITALPTGLVVAGVSAADRRAMGEWRDRFADAFGYRHPDHDSYQFHITFAYMIDWLDDVGLVDWCDTLNDIADDIRTHAPVLELRAPAFCSFEDMNWFEELKTFEPTR